MLVGIHLGKEFQGQWQLCRKIHSEAMAPEQATVICQLLHFPAHSWSALLQHSWLSPFLLPLCKWPARALSWKNLEWAQARTKVDIRDQVRTNGRQLKSLLLNPGLQAVSVVIQGCGWTRCPPEGPFTSTILWCFSEYRQHELLQKPQDCTKYVQEVGSFFEV